MQWWSEFITFSFLTRKVRLIDVVLAYLNTVGHSLFVTPITYSRERHDFNVIKNLCSEFSEECSEACVHMVDAVLEVCFDTNDAPVCFILNGCVSLSSSSSWLGFLQSYFLLYLGGRLLLLFVRCVPSTWQLDLPPCFPCGF